MHGTATSRLVHQSSQADQAWIWPLPCVGDRRPVVHGHGSHARIGYRGDVGEPFVPVLAVRDGVITFVAKTRGANPARYTLCLDHAGGWSTQYGDLVHVLAQATDRFSCRRKPRVRAGDVLGYTAGSPTSLGFELWRDHDDACGPVDLAPTMREWRSLEWSDQFRASARAMTEAR